MNVKLHPFRTTFISEEEVQAWAVNCTEPTTTNGMLTLETCPHCQKEHLYKFVEMPFDYKEDLEKQETEEHYHCTCASCGEYFVAVIGFCY